MKKWIFLIPFAASLLLFIHRPIFVDDSSIFITAQAAARTPLRPYDYTWHMALPNEPAWKEGEVPANTNPPLSAWIMGGAMRLWGEKLAVMHLTMWAFACLALWGAKKIAEECGIKSPEPVWLLACSPMFFLTTQTLYPHLCYLSLYLVTVWLALRLRRLPSQGTAIALGTALSMAALCLEHWPVLICLVGALLAFRTRGRTVRRISLVSAAVFAVLYGGWSAWEIHSYGRSHSLGSILYRVDGSHPAIAWLLPLVFLVGGLPYLLVAWPYAAQRSRTVWAAVLALLVALTTVFASPRGGFSLCEAGFFALAFCTGLLFIISTYLFWRDHSEEMDVILIAWFAAEYLFAQKFFTLPGERHLLMVAFPATLLAIRMVQSLGWSALQRHTCMLGIICLTLGLALADQELAQIGPQAARDLSQIPGRHYFWGNDCDGMSHYFKKAGWQAYDPRTPPTSGDVVIVPKNFNMRGRPPFPASRDYRLVGVKSYDIALPFRTWSIGAGAGWYSSSWGSLPYTFSNKPAETFYLFLRL